MRLLKQLIGRAVDEELEAFLEQQAGPRCHGCTWRASPPATWARRSKKHQIHPLDFL